MAAGAVRVRALEEGDVDVADRIMRVAFGTYLGLAEPCAIFGDAEFVRTRFRAGTGDAWVAELDGAVVGSVLTARWGSFGVLGPLTTHPDVWDRGIGRHLLEPAVESLREREIRQAGLFTFPDSLKHVGLYQRYGFWPRFLTALLAKPVDRSGGEYAALSQYPAAERASAFDSIRELSDGVFLGLDLALEIHACEVQGLGDTLLLGDAGRCEGVAVCHHGKGSEAGSGSCYVKFGAVRPGPGAGDRFERLLTAVESFAAAAGTARLTTGVGTGRIDAYRRLLDRGFRIERLGVSMRLRPEGPDYDGPEQYVLDDLR